MTLPNRVRPDGTIAADPGRGMFMGNRGGRLHRDDRTLGHRRWISKAWICCALAFRGRRRTVMGAGYTELFFLDEVTALAAGHRPCFECRRAAARAFADAFPAGARAQEIDATLHAQRLAPGDRLAARDLAEGAMAMLDGRPVARRGADLLAWSPEGFTPTGPADGRSVVALTPAATRAALARGYAPAWHPSAGG